MDSAFVLRDPRAAARLRALLADVPPEFVDPAAVRGRWDAGARAGRCAEAESMLFVLSASLSVLARAS